MKFLKALTPKSKSNYNPVVATWLGSYPSEYNTTESLTEVRDILGVTNSAYDFGLQAVLVSVNSYTEILNAIEEESLIGFIASYIKPTITISGGQITPIGNQYNLSFTPYRIFKSLVVKLEFYDDVKLKLTLDGESWFCRYSINRGLLNVDFPEELSELKFGIQLFSDFVSGSEINIGLIPNGYPFKKVVDDLINSTNFIHICNKHGKLDTFISMPELPFKVALAALVVYKEQNILNNE